MPYLRLSRIHFPSPGFARRTPLKAVTVIENAFLHPSTSFLNQPRCILGTAISCSIHSYIRVGSIRFVSPFLAKEREIMPPEHITAAQPSGVTRPFESFESMRLALHVHVTHANAAHERRLYDISDLMRSHCLYHGRKVTETSHAT